MAYHDSNKHHWDIGANDLDSPNSEEMSFQEIQLNIDSEVLALTLNDIMSLPASQRKNAAADFVEIDPYLGGQLMSLVSALS